MPRGAMKERSRELSGVEITDSMMMRDQKQVRVFRCLMLAADLAALK